MSLEVRVIRATELPVVHALSGTVNPYVTLQTGFEYNWSKQVAKTRVVYGARNPVFDSGVVFALPICNASKDCLQVNVWDKNAIGNDELIGQGKVELQRLTRDTENVVLLPLLKARKGKGQVEMAIKPIGFGVPAPVVQTVTTTTTTAPTPTVYAPPPYQQSTVVYQQQQPGVYVDPAYGQYYAQQPQVVYQQQQQPGVYVDPAYGQYYAQQPQVVYQQQQQPGVYVDPSQTIYGQVPGGQMYVQQGSPMPGQPGTVYVQPGYPSPIYQ
eukprot:TRINITY_DN148_c0_g1_i1.p1 TRINITY_DN148_c0_g1~~TRINITY_DN148_c0_g1_i1.p1  ORF type:complete len:276 (-),score=29.27 TRINITY_DN148_c0_g1_i1:51-857(-)